MRLLVVVIALVSACKGDPSQAASAGSSVPAGSSRTGSGTAVTGAMGSGTSATGSGASGADPWRAPTVTDPNAPPSLSERAALAAKLCPKVTGPYFFEVAKDGKVSHILGTRHVGVGLAKFPDVVRARIKSAKLAVFEIAPGDHSGRRSHDEALRAELGAADWSHFRDLVGADTATDLEKAPASTAAIAMLVMYEDITNMLDKQIEDLVGDAKIPARGLETAAFQDGVLEELLDLRMLKATIEQTKDRAELEKESADDLEQYCKGTDDTPGMDDDTRGKMKKAGYTDAELDAMDDKLVFARNRDWIPKLEKLFQQSDVFVAVGADHLIGKKGVVSLLSARGFKITRITQ